MKYLLLLLILSGCTDYGKRTVSECGNDLDKCKLVSEGNLQIFHDQCKKLSECMKVDYEIVHFLKQSHNPWACSLTKKSKNYTKNRFLYPRAEISFGEVSFERLEQAINVCELMTETGEFSDASYKERAESWAQFLRDKEKAKQEKLVKPNPLKIKEIQ